MAKAVEQRGGALLVAEDLDPLGERKVCDDDRGPPLGAVGEQVGEQFVSGPLERHEAELVDDQQRDAQVALLQAGERVFVSQFAGDIGCPDEGDARAALDGLDPERDRAIGLARPTDSATETSLPRSMWS